MKDGIEKGIARIEMAIADLKRFSAERTTLLWHQNRFMTGLLIFMALTLFVLVLVESAWVMNTLLEVCDGQGH